jgi:membrane associated rhomboid family serine protease
MLSQLGTVLAINAVISFTIPGISWQGHLGGLLGGLLIGDLWFRSRRMKRTAVVHTVIAILVGLVATISVII